MKWKIANIKIENPVVLAPMAGICDLSFRKIIKSMGCGLLGTEMVSCNAIVHKNLKTMKLLSTNESERPISQQIFGSDIKSFETASKFIHENTAPDIIDINMGCPVSKVAIKSKAGSALLKNPKKVKNIVETVVNTVPIPVTVKIRSGWDENSINAVEIAEIIEDAGASAITVHPRTRSQNYSGKADWSIIKQVKDKVNIPVIGNGDIKTCFDAKAMLDFTNCDAIMIGRGVLGNPWLIHQSIDYLERNLKPQNVTLDMRISLLKKHIELIVKNNPQKVAITKMRTQAAYYFKKQPNTFELKKHIFKVNTKEELFNLIDDYAAVRNLSF